jgi:hypothetical protein
VSGLRLSLTRALFASAFVFAFAFAFPQARAQERRAPNLQRFVLEISQRFGDPKRWGIAGEAAVPEGHTVLKLTELLACSQCVQDFARHQNSTAKYWILDHFLYRLVSAIGSQQANYGIYLNPPPESVSVVINTKSGEIEKFLFGDFASVTVDPSDAILSGVASDLNYAHEDIELASEANLNFQFDGLIQFNEDLVDRFVVQRNFVSLLNEQIRRMEFQYLDLDDPAEGLLQALRSSSNEEEFRARAKERRPLASVIAEIAKAQAEAILKARAAKLYQRLNGEPVFKVSDKTLGDLKALILSGQVAFTSKENYTEWKRFAEPGFFDSIRSRFRTPDELKIVHSGTHAFIVNPTQKKIVGYTLGDLAGLCEDRVL